MKKEKTNNCSECGAFKGHHPICENIDIDEAKRQLKIYFDSYQNRTREAEKRGRDYGIWANILKKNLELWKGKFLVVTHENNKLRKKINDKSE